MERASRYLVGVGVLRNELAREARSELAVTGVAPARATWERGPYIPTLVELESNPSTQNSAVLGK